MQYLKEAEIMQPGGSDPAPWLWENSLPEILCLAMDADEQRNIRDGLQVLETVYLLHEKSSAFAEKPSHAALDEKTLQKSQRDRTDRLFYLLSDHQSSMYSGAGDRPRLWAAMRPAAGRETFHILRCICVIRQRWHLHGFWTAASLIPSASETGKEYLYLSDYGSKTLDIAVFGAHPEIVQLFKDIIAAAQQIEDTERFSLGQW